MLGEFDFFSFGSRQKYSKGELVFAQGATDSNLYYIEKGLFKAVYLTSDGHETIKSFLQQGDVFGSIRSCMSGEPSSFSLVCIEDAHLVQVDFKVFIELTKTNTSAQQQALSFLLNLVQKKEQREYEFLCLNAEERLDAFRLRSPELFNRVKQQDLARYLGITPVALSRIRRKSKS